MSLLGTVAGAAAPAVVKSMMNGDDPWPVNDAALEAEYIRAREELAAWAIEDENGDTAALVLSFAAGGIAGLYTPPP